MEKITFDQRPETRKSRDSLDISSCPQRDHEPRALLLSPHLGQVFSWLTALSRPAVWPSWWTGSECQAGQAGWRWTVLVGSCQSSEELLHGLLSVVQERKVNDLFGQWEELIIESPSSTGSNRARLQGRIKTPQGCMLPVHHYRM